MIRRELSSELVKKLNGSSLWRNICADHELQPEIRDKSITVYYRSGAVLQNLTLNDDNHLTASVVDRYVPIPRRGAQLSLSEKNSDGKLVFDRPLQATSFSDGMGGELESYKAQMDHIRPDDTEGAIVQAICCRGANAILDQEIAFRSIGVFCG